MTANVSSEGTVPRKSTSDPAPSSDRTFDSFGPFYDTAGVARWWGVSSEELGEAVATGAVLACQLADGRWVYPVWQFTTERIVNPSLLKLWKTLRIGDADPWTCLTWLQSAQLELGGRSATEWINDGLPLETPLTVARADATRWGL